MEIVIILLFLFAKSKIFPYNENMKIESSAFTNNEEIPSKFTCDGEGINPELIFSDVPKETKSLVLIVDDPDAPMGTWDHWVLWNISPEITKINQNSTPKNVMVGKNSSNKNLYDSLCPPNGAHHYFFKLYALNTILNLSLNSKTQDVKNAMKEYIIEKAELVGKYKRK